MLAQDVITQMAAQLAREFQPRMIILFGSWARGQTGPESDVDLLVVVQEAGDRRGLRIAMRKALADADLPKDIAVVTAEEFQAKRNLPGSIVYPAAHEGRILYAA